MLTGNLLLHTRRQGRIIPRMVDPADRQLLAGAQALLELADAFQGRRRGELEEAMEDVALPGVQAKVARGLARLVLDRCEFEMGGAADPVALRRDLFDAAAQAWREEGAEELPKWRERVMARVAGTHNLAAADAENILYADLAENHVLTSLRPVLAEGLLHRYNTAQVQGLLLRAARITLSCPSWPSPQRLRQLFRTLKFYGLLFSLETPAGSEDAGGGEFRLMLDGPLSVLESGSRYGLNLAQFLPVLFHWEQPWKLACVLRPRPGSAEGLLEVQPHPFLKSHYPDQGQWVAEEVRQFVESFNALESSWRAAPAEELVALPGNRYLIPDFVFRPAGGGNEEIVLEVLRYPSLDQLTRRMELVQSNGLGNYIIACKDLPALRENFTGDDALFLFRRTLLPTQVNRFLAGRRQQSF